MTHAYIHIAEDGCCDCMCSECWKEDGDKCICKECACEGTGVHESIVEEY